MAGSNLSQDMLKSFVRRIEAVEDEIAALNADKSEIYKEAKSGGFDVKQLRKVIQKRRLPAEERQEQDAVFELYWDAVHGVAIEGSHPRAHAHVENIEEFPAEARRPDPLETLRADPALAIVAAADLPTKSEPQPPQPAGSDLAVPPASLGGRVAPLSETQESHRAETPVGQGAPLPCDDDGEAGKPAGASVPAAPAPLYAAPGVVTWETHPPEGVERSPISIAFGNMGQDAVLIRHDLEKGAAQPIVKIGKVIIDGWARYMAARDMVELNGQPLSYPVVQYDGTDPLIDAIRWNVEGRVLNDDQKKLIAATLTRQNPGRKADIYKAFALFLEPV